MYQAAFVCYTKLCWMKTQAVDTIRQSCSGETGRGVGCSEAR